MPAFIGTLPFLNRYAAPILSPRRNRQASGPARYSAVFFRRLRWGRKSDTPAEERPEHGRVYLHPSLKTIKEDVAILLTPT